MKKEFNVNTILEILKKEFIGETIRVCTYHNDIIVPSQVKQKKSRSVTDKQFESGNPKFVLTFNVSKIIGSHKKYQELPIVDIEYEYDWDNGYEFYAILENGYRIPVKN